MSSAGHEWGMSQDKVTTASIPEADKSAACGGTGTDIDSAAPGSSKSQQMKTVDENETCSKDTSDDDLEMDDSSQPTKQPLDRVQEEYPDFDAPGPDWSTPQGKTKCKPRVPPDGRREQTWSWVVAFTLTI